MLLLAAGYSLAARPVQAQDYTLTGCEPGQAQAGEIVLLSLTGDLPPGDLTVEFFPQRITVLNAYAVDRRALAVQISVPLDAPAGQYNILVYNATGDEALGSQLLEVQRRARVPKISSSAPDEVDAKLSEVKLSLRCDIMDAEALGHLRVEWTVDGQPQEGITTAIARGGVNSISLTVSGEAQPGVALGRVFFDTTPIYLIRLARVSSEWLLFGHRPARATADGPAVELTLLGEGLNAGLLDGATVQLVGDGRSVGSAALECVDGSRATARFSPIPAPGEYSLEVEQGGVVVYQGPLLILPGRSAADNAPSEAAAPPATPQPARSRSRQPQWEEAQAVPAEMPVALPVETVAEQPAEGQPPVEPERVEPEPVVPEPAMPEPPAAPPAYELLPATLDASMPVFRLEIAGFVPDHPDLERYAAELVDGDTAAQLMFMGLGEERLILLFSAPEAGWQPGATYRLRFTRKEDSAELLALEIPAV